MRIKIIDKFTDLKVSRQRKKQLRYVAEGKCYICGKRIFKGSKCRKHYEQSLEYHKKWYIKKKELLSQYKDRIEKT